VDTCTQESISTDSLGRRTGPRRQHTIEEKLGIVKETHAKGACVATVARRHDVNPNQVFAWRQMYRRGLLDPKAPPANPPMQPVKVSTPTVLPTERAVVEVPAQRRRSKPLCNAIEIRLANGHGIVVQGRIDTKLLARVIALLVRR
jgi:transposase-like protein